MGRGHDRLKLVYSAEVAAARRTLKPLVALETSVLAQGLPYPHNVEAAKRCEAAVRDEGAIPAPMAVIEGQLFVGLDLGCIEFLVAIPGKGGRTHDLAHFARATQHRRHVVRVREKLEINLRRGAWIGVVQPHLAT